jgi:hypothetical protein
MPAKTKDLTGQRFGRLLILSRCPNHTKNVVWLCRCDCGKEKRILAGNLRQGHVSSCGCYRREFARKIRVPEAMFNSVVTRMRLNAKKRKVSWGLTAEEVNALIFLPCLYCGVQPAQSSNVTSKFTGRLFSITYNGIDRIEPAIGYTAANCVPCCKACNALKGGWKPADFISRALKIIDGLRRIGYACPA